MKLLIQFAFLFLTFQCINAQHFCGTYEKHTKSLNSSEIIAMDRFGNFYTEQDISPKHRSQKSIQNKAGYFNLFFDNFPETIETVGHPNFGEDIRPLISQVFTDVSDLITQRNLTTTCGDQISPEDVKILVGTDVCGDKEGCENATTSVAGTGSPFFTSYFLFSNYPGYSVIESDVWLRMNSIKEFVPLGFDGRININVENLDFKYNTDFSKEPENDELDLYSIVLHEVLHILGFSSLLTESGEPKPTQLPNISFYSRYDQLLHLTDEYKPENASENINPVLSTSCVDNLFEFNSDITNFESIIQSNCSDNLPDLVLGENAIAPIAGSNGGAVDIINALSHLSENCNNPGDQFVMSPSIMKGQSKRVLSDQELEILCKLGYNVNSPSCTDCYSAAIFDNFGSANSELMLPYYNSCCYQPLYGNVNEVISFSNLDLLCNDNSAGEIEVTNLYQAYGVANSMLTELPNGNYNFETSKSGIYQFYYTVKSCECYTSTSVFEIIISDPLADCELNTCENVICYGDYEAYEKTNYINYQTGFDQLFLFESAFQNSVDVCEVNGNKVASIVNQTHPEGQLIPLKNPLKPGCELTISVDLASRNGQAGEFNIFGSNHQPCLPNESLLSEGCNGFGENNIINNCGDRLYRPICLVDSEPINNFSAGSICPNSGLELVNYSWTFENNETEDMNYLVIYNSRLETVMWMDNLIVSQVCKPDIEMVASDFVIDLENESLVYFDICFDNNAIDGFVDDDIEVEITALPIEVSLGSGGDFSSGVSVLNNVLEGECRTMELSLIGNTVGIFADIEIVARSVNSCKSIIVSVPVEVKNLSSTNEYTLNDLPKGAILNVYNIQGQLINRELVVDIKSQLKKQAKNQIIIYTISKTEQILLTGKYVNF